MNEFDLIHTYFNWKPYLQPLEVGIGDDGAVMNIHPNRQIVSSIDTLIEGVHFPKNTAAQDIAHKALAVNLSDLAAMGAVPKYFTLALTLPELNTDWLSAFSDSLKQLCGEYKISLIGGDTSKGDLSITINIMGEVVTGQALLRSSAKAGDGIFLSNTIGDAAYAWQQIKQGHTPSKLGLERLNRPIPRVLLAQKLVCVANACIDISDGLEQDLTHILKASNTGARVNLSDIPLSNEVHAYIKKTNDWCVALSGGDDYELCFTVPNTRLNALNKIQNALPITLTQIGVITENKGLERVGGFDGQCNAYQHF